MKPPLTPMMASPGSIPAFPAGLSGATSMTFRTSRPLTWTCSARIPSRCTIDPAAAGVEVEGGAVGAWAGAASAGGSGSLGTRFWATDAGLVEPVGERSFPAALRPGVEVRANLTLLGG